MSATEYMECGCELVRCENPDCREPIYAPDGVCRACVLPSLCENGCGRNVTVVVQLPRGIKSVCESCAAEGGDEELLEATDILWDGATRVR